MAVRERLSREAIVTSAIALADAEGLEAVTIRRLATDQGVTPMALYWHFKDKDLLLDGIAERLLSEVELPPAPIGDDDRCWSVRLRELLDAVLTVLRAHPHVADLVHTRFLGSPAGLDIAERAFGLLTEAGFDPEQRAQVAVHLLHTMVLLVSGEPGQRIGRLDDESQQEMRVKKAALLSLAPERYPSLLDCADELTGPPREREYFDLGMRMLMAGVRGIAP